MMRQNTQPAEFPSPSPSPPAAAPPPLVHADVETAPFGSDSCLAGPPGRRWEQSTASRRGGDISGVGTAGITSVAFKMKRIRLPSPILTLQTALNEPSMIDCFPLVDRKMV
ncbi:hypothetical protein HU200_033549 [Digitaria exilis]|uniref:Uncharacterized protein n=1 Tax=Digitaria exilis TaxID=1010633 RepID=A0A835EMX5_9POAL|nr:hypothetical protein HU200_033549 [Digitaria exilis]